MRRLALALLFTGCAAFRQDVRTALNVAEQSCVLAQPVEASVPAIVAACGIVEALYPELNQLLSAKRAAMVLKAVEKGGHE